MALESFAQNTIEFMRHEQDLLFSRLKVPTDLAREMRGRQVLVVVRGYDYRQDLAALRTYLREVRPFIIGVDGGADALLEAGGSRTWSSATWTPSPKRVSGWPTASWSTPTLTGIAPASSA